MNFFLQGWSDVIFFFLWLKAYLLYELEPEPVKNGQAPCNLPFILLGTGIFSIEN